MHDAKGRELKVGDRVMLPCTVIRLGDAEGYCNVSILSEATMPPEHKGSRISIGAVNTKQILRANDGDDLAYEVAQDGEARIIR
jgi:hypothetical protein